METYLFELLESIQVDALRTSTPRLRLVTLDVVTALF